MISEENIISSFPSLHNILCTYLDEAKLHALQPGRDGLGPGAVNDDPLDLLVLGQRRVQLEEAPDAAVVVIDFSVQEVRDGQAHEGILVPHQTIGHHFRFTQAKDVGRVLHQRVITRHLRVHVPLAFVNPAVKRVGRPAGHHSHLEVLEGQTDHVKHGITEEADDSWLHGGFLDGLCVCMCEQR